MLRKILLLFWLTFALPASVSAQTPSGQFLHLSDIHFDPFADPTLVTELSAAPVDQWEAILQKSGAQTPVTGKNQDSNYALLKSALEGAKQPLAPHQPPPDYDYIVYTGDYLAHGFMDEVGDYIKDKDPKKADAKQKAFAAQSVAFVNWMIQKYFPGKPLIATLGNNDSNCGDYKLTPGGDLMPGVETSLPVVANDPAALTDFEAGGYYRTPHPTIANVDFLVLSIFWSNNWRSKCPSKMGDPRAAQMKWLGDKLAETQQSGRRAILLMHIPPGMDAYSSYKARGPGNTMWTSDGKMLSQFQALAVQYKAQLVDGYAGHTHMDEFRVVAESGPANGPIMAIRMGPSVTPYNGNRPSFTAVNYDTADGSATDYTVSAFASAAWNPEYTFTTAYGFQRYNAANLQKIVTDGTLRNLYAGYYATGNNTPATSYPTYFACALTGLTPANYATCVKPKSRKMRN